MATMVPRVTIEDVIHTMQSADLPPVPEDVKPDVPLVRQGYDSLDMATLMMALEAKFQKTIPLDKTPRLRTLADIVAFLNT